MLFVKLIMFASRGWSAHESASVSGRYAEKHAIRK